MPKNKMKPYGRDIPEKGGNNPAESFNRTTEDINSEKEVVKKTKMKK